MAMQEQCKARAILHVPWGRGAAADNRATDLSTALSASSSARYLVSKSSDTTCKVDPQHAKVSNATKTGQSTL
jgi:hypothetical protein